jgi:hypothetical protein
MKSRRSPSAISFCLAAVYLLWLGPAAQAMPEFLERFNQDPFSRSEYRNQCATCHVDPSGGGPRNPFGRAFEDNDKVITPALRAAWPDRFLSRVSAAALPASGTTIQATFLANEQETILQIGGEYFRLRSKEARLEPIEAAEVARLTGALSASPAAVAPAPQESRVPLRNQPTFDHYLVNLPTTLPYPAKGLSLRFNHRFAQPVLRAGADCPECGDITDLFGFDSFSYSSFGVEAGITQRLAATFYRSPLNRTYEFGGIARLLQQGGRTPLSAALRVNLETRRLIVTRGQDSRFERFQTVSFALPVSRAISDVAEIFVEPLLSLRANPLPPEAGPYAAEGERRRNLGAIGLGASVRLRPRVAVVAEWIPRVGGFHAADSRNALSFGIQRTTNGHVFELVLTNTLGTTTSQMGSVGSRDFSLGFNLYRRLR